MSRWLGAAGCAALFSRALADTRTDHTALADVRLGEDPQQVLEGVSQAVQRSGAVAVAAGLEALLIHLLELLGRLVGSDIVVRLLELSAPDDASDEGGSRD